MSLLERTLPNDILIPVHEEEGEKVMAVLKDLASLCKQYPTFLFNYEGRSWDYFGYVDEDDFGLVAQRIQGMRIEVIGGIPYVLGDTDSEGAPMKCHEPGKVGIYVEAGKRQELIDKFSPSEN